MANICTTEYKITGPSKSLCDIWNTLQMMDVNNKDVYLYKLAERYGIDYKNSGISVRGIINWAEFDENEYGGLLSFNTESAWSACDMFFDKLNDAFGNELSINYREIECGCGIFYVHDEGFFFPEECCISSHGGQFEDSYEYVYNTITEAIDEWCEKTGITRGNKNDDEMIEYINGYKYEDDETYFYINKFTFV